MGVETEESLVAVDEVGLGQGGEGVDAGLGGHVGDDVEVPQLADGVEADGTLADLFG